MVAAVDADHKTEVPTTPGFDAGERVLDDRCAPGLDPKPAGGLDEDGGVGLPIKTEAICVEAVDSLVEEPGYARRFENLSAVAGRGDDRRSSAPRPQSMQ
jgi:hypothetical protein